MKINVTRSSMPDFNEYIEEIAPLWDSRFLTNGGVKHKEFENRLCGYFSCDNVVLFTNGHLALEYIISAYRLKGEIITTPFTFASTTHAIYRCGLTPVFCDIKKDDYTIDPDKIEELITPDTSAIMAVHVYGKMCDTEKINKIAKKHNLKVIYDAAHAFGVKKDGIPSAAYGDASMFSFHATKVFHSIEGGCIATNDGEVAEKLNTAKNFGQIGNADCIVAGGNAKMNEFQAAMGICNLRHIDKEIEKRKTAHDKYVERLSGVEGIIIPAEQKGVEHNYSYFPVVFDGYKLNRDEVIELLAKHDIGARRYFYPLTNEFECYRHLPTAGGEKTPVAYEISRKVLTLPLYAGLSEDEVNEICDIILK